MTKTKPIPQDEPALVVNRKDAVRLTGLSLSSIDRAIAAKQLNAKKYGWRTLIPRSEIERFLNALPNNDNLSPKGTPSAPEKAKGA